MLLFAVEPHGERRQVSGAALFPFGDRFGDHRLPLVGRVANDQVARDEFLRGAGEGMSGEGLGEGGGAGGGAVIGYWLLVIGGGACGAVIGYRLLVIGGGAGGGAVIGYWLLVIGGSRRGDGALREEDEGVEGGGGLALADLLDL